MAGKNLQTRLKNSSLNLATANLRENGLVEVCSKKIFSALEDRKEESTAMLYLSGSMLHFIKVPGINYTLDELEDFQGEMGYIANYVKEENLPRYIESRLSLNLSSVGGRGYNSLVQ